jgi:cytochrome c-type biogenesis protein CcmH/NrfG
VVADFRRVTPDLDAALADAEALLESRDALGAAIRAGAVLGTDPDHVPTLLLMARAQMALGHPETGVAAAEHACGLAPEDGAAAGVLSAALTAAGRHDDAVRAAGRAVRAGPRRAAGYDRLAGALVGAGRFGEAEEAVRTAAMLAPDGTDRLLTLAAAQAGLGHRDQARRTLLGVLAQDPRHPEARQLLAGLRAPAPGGGRRSSANRTMVVPALVMVLIGTVLLALRVTAGAVACLTLAAVLLLGGFRGNRSE